MKRIVDQRTLKAWQQSAAYRDILTYVQQLCDAASGRRLTDDVQTTSASVSTIVDALDSMQGWLAEIPPLKQQMRYGNRAFKTWHARLVDFAPELARAVGELAKLGRAQPECLCLPEELDRVI